MLKTSKEKYIGIIICIVETYVEYSFSVDETQ